jgi:hypothetical protein
LRAIWAPLEVYEKSDGLPVATCTVIAQANADVGDFPNDHERTQLLDGVTAPADAVARPRIASVVPDATSTAVPKRAFRLWKLLRILDIGLPFVHSHP